MTINFANVDISLKKFQDISTGDYNAGEVRLSGKHSLAKMNHHITRRSANDTVISHAEVLAIKNAFIRALQGNGVNDKEIALIRQELGLAPKGAVDRSLRARSIRPLSRQQIRDILDRNADTINAHNANNPNAVRIRTSQQIYGPAGMDAESVAVRDAVNAANAHLQHKENTKISLQQALVSGDVDFRSENDKEEILKIAEQQLDNILAASHGKPRDNKTPLIHYTMSSGQKVVFPTGKSEAAYVRHLEDIIARLRTNGPTKNEMEIRKKISSFANRAECDAWLQTLANDKQGGLKARVFLVKLLHDSGIADADTLTLPNRLNAADAITLARHLISLPTGTLADQLLADPQLRAMAQKPRAVIEKNGSVFVPATSTQDYNKWVANQINSQKGALPPNFKALMNNIKVEIRALYGSIGCPDNLSLSSLVPQNMVTKICGANDPDASRVTPEAVHDALLAEAKNLAIDRLIQDKARAALASIEGGADFNENHVLNHLKGRHPALVKSLLDAKNPAEAEAILAKHTADIANCARNAVRLKGFQGKVKEWAREALAWKLGVSADVFAGDDLNLKRLNSNAETLVLEIGKGIKPLESDEAIEGAFRELVNKFVDERILYIQKIDASPLPAAAKEELKTLIITGEKIKDFDMEALLREAAAIDVSEIETLIRNHAPKDQIYAAMAKYTTAVDTAVQQRLLAHRKEIGPEDCHLPEDLITTAVVMARPGLDRLLREFFQRDDVRNDDFFSWQHDPNGPAAARRLLRYSPYSKLDNHRAFAKRLQDFRMVNAFLEGPGAQKAIAEGYHKSELPALAKAYAFYKAATGCSDADAITAALDPQSKANRLIRYGGRFAKNAENFRQGLALMDKFTAWYAQTHADYKAGRRDTPTLLNFTPLVCTKEATPAVEMFLFDEIARNDALPLNADNPEEVFGMEHNPAMRFVGRGYTQSFANSLAQIPPEKRQTIYAVFDAMDPLSRTAQQKATSHEVSQGGLLAARILKNYDAVIALQKNGQFDRPHLVSLLYADLGVEPNATNQNIDTAYYAKLAGYGNIFGSVHLLIAESGDTVEDGVAAIREGRRLPLAPGISAFNGALEELDGTSKHGRTTMVGDLIRPTIPARLDTKGPAITSENAVFTFHLGNGETLVSKPKPDEKMPGTEKPKTIYQKCAEIADKLETFCGKVHSKQISSLFYALSQSAVGTNVKGGFIPQGIVSDEHMALTYTLTKNEETGTITIKYSEPAGFPFHFHWTADIDLNGIVTTTPMVIENVGGQAN